MKGYFSLLALVVGPALAEELDPRGGGGEGGGKGGGGYTTTAVAYTTSKYLCLILPPTRAVATFVWICARLYLTISSRPSKAMSWTQKLTLSSSIPLPDHIYNHGKGNYQGLDRIFDINHRSNAKSRNYHCAWSDSVHHIDGC